MPPITILTDSAVQTIHKTFPGDDLIQVVPLMPVEGTHPEGYRLLAGTDQEVQSTLQKVSQTSGSIIAILTSGSISAFPNQILKLIKAASAPPRLVMIDTQSIGIGVGFLVEKAAGLALSGRSPADIEQIIREDCSTIYSTMILPDLKPLVPMGLVDAAQANAASILGIHSIFSLEDGLPTPLCKVRSRRAAYEYLVEFIDEFEKFHVIAVVQESKAETGDIQIITDHLLEFFPGTALQVYFPNKAWNFVFGEHSYGLVIVSNER
ncbi:DegV family protein [Leptolinea tardivitalis]|uniref:DegV family EDD domain-containing protein n=1 Tax=Leptolinea tardivitalis TaxID=229920 RepID=A0A0P6WRZ3_9CHLR|nr:DegV family protein [Leptolinea tardivitalis]KPL71712.1 hypothetical protein ADM99_09645 [Leptolinea tardivitalis]GAP20065.1 uncharacterized protein conserved in bacteria [Leptolinea tardivitalis]